MYMNRKGGKAMNYLDFKPARCKDCYRCLRECPVNAIQVINHQASIIAERCILCGNCINVCPQNAKTVHSEADDVMELLSSGQRVVASVAPSFISSFKLNSFDQMERALSQLGFSYCEETAVGAAAVTAEYKRLLESGTYRNLISSACPAVNRLVQIYYPEMLKYLAPVDSPMLAHAKLLKKRFPDGKIVFIGPCIAKKREGEESGIIDGVLTFEDLRGLLDEKNITFQNSGEMQKAAPGASARIYPTSRGIIRSFCGTVPGYDYVAAEGIGKCHDILENMDSMSGMFVELNCCEYACINGPCSLIKRGSAVEADAKVRRYAASALEAGVVREDIGKSFERINVKAFMPSERQIKEILAKTGKTKPEDELNCGACGYSSCREKAWAVANGYADVEMCIPYMRSRAESMSDEVMRCTPNGIVMIDYDFRIQGINDNARRLLGIDGYAAKGSSFYDYVDIVDFVLAKNDEKNLHNKKVFINQTHKYVELSIEVMSSQKMMLGVLKDVTEEEDYNRRLREVREKTFEVTDGVIKKQMWIAQEIASLLGETTAETKVALLKLKEMLKE
jgi:iron only hydrogenase large subunit-like protein